jgi:hypothetical protein
MCHDGGKVVIRHGWEPVAQGCRPRDGDQVIDLDEEVESDHARTFVSDESTED